jgi:succinyl-diaminopimelate desuccinylase
MDLLYYGEFSIMEQAACMEEGNHTNLIGLKGPRQDGGLLLVSSLRGEPAGDPALWTETRGRPLTARTHGGRVYGQNVLSGKIDLLCKVIAAMRTPKASLKQPLWLAATFGGEAAAHRGGEYMLESGLLRPTSVLVGYPTNLELVREHRGHLVFRIHIRRAKNIWRLPRTHASYRIEFRGSPAHGSAPHLGRNAAAAGLAWLTRLAVEGLATVHNVTGGDAPNRVPDRLTAALLTTGTSLPPAPPSATIEPLRDGAEVSFPVNDCLQIGRPLGRRIEQLLSSPPRFDAPDGSAWPRGLWNLGQVSTNPSGLTLTYELRGAMDHDTEALLERIEELCAAAGDATKQHTVELEVIKDQPPLAAFGEAPEQPLFERCREALREVGVTPTDGDSDGHTEAWLFSAWGLDTVVFGPGFPTGVLSRPNEHIPLVHLEKAIQFYERIIQKMCCV